MGKEGGAWPAKTLKGSQKMVIGVSRRVRIHCRARSEVDDKQFHTIN